MCYYMLFYKSDRIIARAICPCALSYIKSAVTNCLTPPWHTPPQSFAFRRHVSCRSSCCSSSFSPYSSCAWARALPTKSLHGRRTPSVQELLKRAMFSGVPGHFRTVLLRMNRCAIRSLHLENPGDDVDVGVLEMLRVGNYTITGLRNVHLVF